MALQKDGTNLKKILPVVYISTSLILVREF